MTLQRLENESVLDHKYRLLLEKSKGEVEYGWDEIANELNTGLAKDTIRKGSIFLPEFDEYLRNKLTGGNDELPQYKEVNEYKADGSHVSDKLIKLSEQDLKNPDKLLEAHGFDKTQWTLTGARNSLWNSSADKTLHSSRITVKPKVDGFDIEGLVKVLKQEIKPVHIDKDDNVDGVELLSIPFVDLHFGINTIDNYTEKLNDTLEIINSKYWNAIYIPIGHDLIHVNDSKNRTANGTIVEPIDIPKAWKDAFSFYSNIIETALKQTNNVVSDYVCGNHDADLTWGFMQALEVKFPQVKWNTSMENKKYFKWNEVLLVSTHGERGLKRVTNTLITKYRDLMVGAKCIEIYSGHIHNQQVSDNYGILVRSLPTSAKEDDWHVSQSFEGSVKNSQIFVYKKDRIKTIYHV